MSYKTYLQERTNYYVIEDFKINTLSKYTSKDEMNSLLMRVESVALNVANSIAFIETHNQDVIDVINGTLDKLEAKVQAIKRSAKALSKSNKSADSISDICNVDITQGLFEGAVYSLTKEGIVLGSIESVRLI